MDSRRWEEELEAIRDGHGAGPERRAVRCVTRTGVRAGVSLLELLTGSPEDLPWMEVLDGAARRPVLAVPVEPSAAVDDIVGTVEIELVGVLAAGRAVAGRRDGRWIWPRGPARAPFATTFLSHRR